MCEILGIPGNYWSVTGLAADFVGVGLLGFDLVRLQRLVRRRAREGLAKIEAMADDYGGIESWAAEIKDSAKWIPQHAYSRYHLEDEVSYNARQNREDIGNIASCVNGLAEHLSRIMLLYSEQAKDDFKTTRISLHFSIAGIVIIGAGFLLQIVGAWGC